MDAPTKEKFVADWNNARNNIEDMDKLARNNLPNEERVKVQNTIKDLEENLGQIRDKLDL